MKKISSFILRISITLALLIFLFRKTDFASLSEIIKRSDRIQMFFAFCIFLFLNFLVLLRWHFLLKGLEIKVALHRLLLSYLSSLLFNLVLPSTIGGDTVRTLDIARHTKTHSSGILATVILDRVSGFLGLVTVLIFALIFGFRVLNDNSVLLAAAILLAIMVFLSGIMFSQRFFNGVFKFLPFKKIKDYLYKIHSATSSYKQKRDILVAIWFLSLMIHIGLCFVYYFIALSVGIHLKPIYFIVFVPVITAFSAIPVSVGGLGVRDTASVFLFAKVGLAAEQAFTISLMNFGFMFIMGLLGGISHVFALHNRRL